MLLIILLFHSVLLAQKTEISDPDKRTDWWGDIDGFYNQQASISLRLVNDVLKNHPPEVEEPLIRKLALLLIDNVLHEEKAPLHKAVHDFFRNRMETAVEEIRTTKVSEGAVIWKLYNHAFVVKTSSVTIGFDIQKGLTGNDGFMIGDEMMKMLVKEIDMLFISHYHRDHADPATAELFLSGNKPVITPPDLWTDLPVFKRVTHPERKAHEIQEILIPQKNLRIKFVNYPGHQGEKILNNVYLVFTPEGLSFSHTGDQSNSEDFLWMKSVSDFHSVDVLMVNTWGLDPEKRLAKGFRPQLIIAGHENEMGHSVDHREPYWLNYPRLEDRSVMPWIHMAWGEKYHYIPPGEK